jgi:hypothetical protein
MRMGHRSKKAIIPSGIEIEFLPAYSPELQPAERLWQLIDEPLVNQYFEREGCWGFPSLSNHAVETINEIENVLVERCCVVSEMKDEVGKLTNYHWLQYSDCLPTF